MRLALHRTVPVILDRVVSAAVKQLSDFSPLVADQPMHQEENPLFLRAPVNLFYQRVQMIVPPLPALLAHAAGEIFRNGRPSLGTVLFD